MDKHDPEEVDKDNAQKNKRIEISYKEPLSYFSNYICMVLFIEKEPKHPVIKFFVVLTLIFILVSGFWQVMEAKKANEISNESLKISSKMAAYNLINEEGVSDQVYVESYNILAGYNKFITESIYDRNLNFRYPIVFIGDDKYSDIEIYDSMVFMDYSGLNLSDFSELSSHVFFRYDELNYSRFSLDESSLEIEKVCDINVYRSCEDKESLFDLVYFDSSHIDALNVNSAVFFVYVDGGGGLLGFNSEVFSSDRIEYDITDELEDFEEKDFTYEPVEGYEEISDSSEHDSYFSIDDSKDVFVFSNYTDYYIKYNNAAFNYNFEKVFNGKYYSNDAVRYTQIDGEEISWLEDDCNAIDLMSDDRRVRDRCSKLKYSTEKNSDVKGKINFYLYESDFKFYSNVFLENYFFVDSGSEASFLHASYNDTLGSNEISFVEDKFYGCLGITSLFSDFRELSRNLKYCSISEYSLGSTIGFKSSKEMGDFFRGKGFEMNREEFSESKNIRNYFDLYYDAGWYLMRSKIDVSRDASLHIEGYNMLDSKIYMYGGVDVEIIGSNFDDLSYIEFVFKETEGNESAYCEEINAIFEGGENFKGTKIKKSNVKFSPEGFCSLGEKVFQ